MLLLSSPGLMEEEKMKEKEGFAGKRGERESDEDHWCV